MSLSAAKKIALLHDLTRGPEDVFALRGRTWGPVYAPINEWNLNQHLAGVIELGTYGIIPPGPDEAWPRCRWIAADFDGKRPGCDWQRDVQRVVEFLHDATPALFVNLSRSAKGAHVRVLFRDPVPAWMARRWMMAWLEEAEVVDDYDGWDRELPSSFDILVPRQDLLDERPTRSGNRGPGNLVGCPLQGRLVRLHGGTVPLDVEEVVRGRFEPDGKHWDHVQTALAARSWGEVELRAAMADAPGNVDTEPPRYAIHRHLNVIQADDRHLDLTVKFCAFMLRMQQPGHQSYPLWIALASQLHRFGDAGRDMFHTISAQDPGYRADVAERKWAQTSTMTPIRCDTLVEMGYRCPHLFTPHCNGTNAPAFLADNSGAEIL